MRKAILSFIIVLFSFAINAQQNYSFHHIKVEDGLSQSSVICMHQDKKGLIWIGTADGLNKYDGTKFTYYKHDPNDSTSLSATSVLSIYEDDKENFWLGTDGGGLNIFDPHTEKFTCYTNNKDDSSSISSNRVTDVLHDGGTKYLVSTFGGGLNIFDASTKKFFTMHHKTDDENSISNNSIYKLYKTSDGLVWLLTRGGLDVLNTKTGKIIHYKNNPADSTSIPDDKVQSIYEDKEERLWIGTYNGGLCEFDKQSQKFIRYKEKNETPSAGYNYINCFYEDSKNQLWIGYFGKGIKILNKKTGALQSIMLESGNENSLASDEVLCFLNDHSNMLWVGTNGGISLYDKTFGYFNRLNKIVDSKFSNKNIYSIYKDAHGTTWVGTNGGGLYSIGSLNEVTNYSNDPSKKNSLSNNDVWCISEDRYNTIWIGTKGGGVNIFDESTHSFFSHHDTTLNSLKNIWSIFRDDENYIWVGTASDGVLVYDTENKKPSIFNDDLRKDPRLRGKSIYCITQSGDGLIFLGTRNSGLNIYDKKERSLKHYVHDANDKNSISSNNVQCIYEQESNYFWLGTNGGGLNLFDKRTEKFICYTERDGLPNNVIYGILPDKQGNLWLSTNKGICKFSLNIKALTTKPEITNYNSKDGLPSDEFNQGAYYKESDGSLYFGGINGIACFSPDSVKENQFVPPVILTGFKIFEKNYSLDTSITYKKTITLNYKQNFFSFEFAALNYLLPEKNNYAFMMEGFDGKWNYSGNRRYASYTNLDPGAYTFKVKASNNDGAWNENYASVKIIITPPFWKTWWFKILVALFILLLAWSFYKYRINQIRKEEKKKTEFKIALSEVEMKALRAQMNPHFIFNSLNSINKYIITNDRKSASDYLARFSRLIRLVLENSMDKTVSLKKDMEALELYMQMEQLRFETPFDYEIRMDDDLQMESILVPPLLFQPFVENSILHGLMPKETKGKICIQINAENHLLQCTVEDNGIGREKAGKLNAGKHRDHRSLGMKVTEERVAILNQGKNGELKVKVTDLKDNLGSASGTRIEISVPVSYNY